MVAIVFSNTVQADQPITKYCIDGGPFCGENKTDCKALLEGTTGEHKNEKLACIVFCFALTYYNFKAFMFPGRTF